MGQPLGYPVGGYGRMSEDFAQVVKDCGSEIKTRARVERILIEDGRATGVLTKDAVYRAPIVVSNAGLQPTVLKLIGEQYFDKSYVSYVKGLLPSNGFTGAHWVLGETVLDCGLYQVWSDDAWWDLDRQDEVKKGKMPADLIITVLVPTNYDPEMGPPGKQLLIFGTPCSSNPADKSIEALWKKTDEQMAEMFPEIVPVRIGNNEQRVGCLIAGNDRGDPCLLQTVYQVESDAGLHRYLRAPEDEERGLLGGWFVSHPGSVPALQLYSSLSGFWEITLRGGAVMTTGFPLSAPGGYRP